MKEITQNMELHCPKCGKIIPTLKIESTNIGISKRLFCPFMATCDTCGVQVISSEDSIF